MALSEIAKRGFRSLWVLFVNGFVVRRIFISFFGDPFNRATVYTKNEIEFVLWAGLPILGMVFELINSRFARWLNVGYLSAFALLYLVDAVQLLVRPLSWCVSSDWRSVAGDGLHHGRYLPTDKKS